MSDILKKSSKSIKEVNKRDDTAENKYFEENMNDDVFSLESNEDKTENEDSEEKRRERLEKIEKRLGRYDKAKEIRLPVKNPRYISSLCNKTPAISDITEIHIVIT